MLPPGVIAQFKDTVTVHLVSGRDAYDVPVETAVGDVKARVTYGEQSVSVVDGNQIVTSIKVHMEDIAGFTSEASITLPDGKKRPVKRFNRPAWPDGTRHLAVYL